MSRIDLYKKITAVHAMKLLGMKNNTFYRRVKEYETTLTNKLQ